MHVRVDRRAVPCRCKTCTACHVVSQSSTLVLPFLTARHCTPTKKEHRGGIIYAGVPSVPGWRTVRLQLSGCYCQSPEPQRKSIIEIGSYKNKNGPEAPKCNSVMAPSTALAKDSCPLGIPEELTAACRFQRPKRPDRQKDPANQAVSFLFQRGHKSIYIYTYIASCSYELSIFLAALPF